MTLTVAGVPQIAHVAAWPGESSVRVWWLRVPATSGDPADVSQAPLQVRDLTAYDLRGKVLASVPDNAVAAG